MEDSGNQEGDDADRSHSRRLPEPKFALKEERPDTDGRSHEAAGFHRPETKDAAGEVGPDADEQADEGIFDHFVEVREAEDEAADADDAGRQDPVVEHQFRSPCAFMLATVRLA